MSTTELQFFKVPESKDERFNHTLNTIFPSNTEERKLAQARETLELPDNIYSDEKLTALLADFEFIANAWLDLFERKQFNGKSLAEILKK